MVVALIIVLPGTNMPQIITTPWQDNTSLLATLQTVSQNPPSSGPFSFAVQYGGKVLNDTPGYNLVMLNGSWTTSEATAPATAAPAPGSSSPTVQPNFWSIEVNGQPLKQGVDEYQVQDGDIIVFMYNGPAPAPTA